MKPTVTNGGNVRVVSLARITVAVTTAMLGVSLEKLSSMVSSAIVGMVPRDGIQSLNSGKSVTTDISILPILVHDVSSTVLQGAVSSTIMGSFPRGGALSLIFGRPVTQDISILSVLVPKISSSKLQAAVSSAINCLHPETLVTRDISLTNNIVSSIVSAISAEASLLRGKQPISVINNDIHSTEFSTKLTPIKNGVGDFAPIRAGGGDLAITADGENSLLGLANLHPLFPFHKYNPAYSTNLVSIPGR